MIALAKEISLDYEIDTHDIYLNDVRKTKTENLITVISYHSVLRTLNVL